MIPRRNAARLLAPATAMLVLSACATVPGQNRLAERDPLEKFNRGVWGVNMAADKVLIKPVSQAYRAVAPRPVRQGVTNAFANLTEPWSFINNILQGKPKRAVRNLSRFIVNTTIGIGGLFDQASKMKIRPAPEDFGQTLARWGVNGGPYLVLPLLGPSTLRDGVGTGVASYADPVRVAVNQADVDVWYKRGFVAAQVISGRSDLTESGGDAFLQSSLDPYAAARSAFLQRRAAAIVDQGEESDSDLPAGSQPVSESVPTPAGDAATSPPAPDAALPETAAPMPGDEPGAAPAPSATPLPDSAAPMPGDEPTPPGSKPQT
ncbi:VacJ family lipoprotein [Sphingomonas crusticola]|uniref:MlaA family lipoprotein n=1 Tax=Sphingomonas crusticola TaxID=1697973 RepID=UPI000E22854D|nr:VacJ family lipoprotein [Sphingomonas crusticola]